MVVRLLDRIIRAERFGDGTRVWGQVRFRHREVRSAGAIIDGGIVILNALGDGRTETLPVIAGRDTLALRWIADETALKQDRWNFYIAQNMKARMTDSAIDRGEPR